MKSLKDTKFLYKVKEFYKKNRHEILDIVLFGSVVRGKEKPKDIDILILYKDKENLELNYVLKKSLEGQCTIQVTSKTYNSLLSESFKAREAFLLEGYSLVKKEAIAQSLGFFSTVIFKYSLRGKSKSERMRFYYSLYGREKKDKGILQELNLTKFSETILLSPVAQSEKVKEFLDSWSIEYKEFPVLIPIRLRHIL